MEWFRQIFAQQLQQRNGSACTRALHPVWALRYDTHAVCMKLK